MIPKIIHQTSGVLTPEEARLGHRMRGILQDWEYRFWTDAQNESLVEEWFPKYLPVFRKIRHGVIKADIARYMYLAAFGGFYFDTDYKMLRAIDDEMLSHRCVLPISRNNGTSVRVGNAVIGSEAGHPLWSDFIAHIFTESGLADLPKARIEEVTGPDGLTAFFFARQDVYEDVYLPTRSIFHPPLANRGFTSHREPTTLGVHLSWGSWRTVNPLTAARKLLRRKITSVL
jgi:mannosyltransferase OCH1-like enzyme